MNIPHKKTIATAFVIIHQLIEKIEKLEKELAFADKRLSAMETKRGLPRGS